MRISDSTAFDKGDLAWAAVKGIEDMLETKGHKLDDDSDSAIYDAVWMLARTLTFKEA